MSNIRPLRPTINDVARASGVSKKTVSRVINDSPLVTESTREKVQSVIKELKFTPDPQARALASSQSFLIGVVYDNPNALYIDYVQRGVIDVCRSAGYELVVHPASFNSDTMVDDVMAFVHRLKPDGIILLSPISQRDDLVEELKLAGCHYIRLASSNIDDSAHLVMSHDQSGAKKIVTHLIDLGHKDIAFITGPNHYKSTIERKAGYLSALEEKGIDPVPDFILEGAYTYESGISCAKKLLSGEHVPTAIFAGNDEMACGVIKEAMQRGLKVPEDISVAGFDDSIIASRVFPNLTTVHRSASLMGKLAAEKIIASLKSGIDAARDVQAIIEPELIIRESTGIPKAK